MFKCLNKRLETKEIETDYRPSTFAIIIGHNFKSQGAINYLGESEFTFNSRIAKKLQFILSDNNFSSTLIYRPIGNYDYQCEQVARFCIENKITHSVNLHFNSYKKNVQGCECLIADSITDYDNKLADKITDLLELYFNISQRGQGGVVTVDRMHRGAKMLYTLRDAGVTSVIIEPLFANFRTTLTEKFFEHEDEYVKLLSRAILETLNV